MKFLCHNNFASDYARSHLALMLKYEKTITTTIGLNFQFIISTINTYFHIEVGSIKKLMKDAGLFISGHSWVQ